MYELLKCKHFNCDRAHENKLLKYNLIKKGKYECSSVAQMKKSKIFKT